MNGNYYAYAITHYAHLSCRARWPSLGLLWDSSYASTKWRKSVLRSTIANPTQATSDYVSPEGGSRRLCRAFTSCAQPVTYLLFSRSAESNPLDSIIARPSALDSMGMNQREWHFVGRHIGEDGVPVARMNRILSKSDIPHEVTVRMHRKHASSPA